MLTLALPPIFHATLHPARCASFIFCSLMWCKFATFMMTRSRRRPPSFLRRPGSPHDFAPGRSRSHAAPPRLLLAPWAPDCFRSRSPKRAAPSSDAPIGRPVATRAASRALCALMRAPLATSAPGLGMPLPLLSAPGGRGADRAQPVAASDHLRVAERRRVGADDGPLAHVRRIGRALVCASDGRRRLRRCA